jgi:HD-like signal output (HDOD) protein/ActR/RegA family two-component response regulator
MKSILFVDDEPMVLAGIKRMLRSRRSLWDMAFAGGGAEALAILETRPFDVVVTDMRMPSMDGARLLELVKERYPGTIRIVLSGYFEDDAALRAVPVAHQYLAKPCDPQKLTEAIERSCGLAGLLPDAALRRVVGAIGKLPALPRTSAWLAEALQKPDPRLDEIARIVEQDVGITAKILQLVNSAFFGLREHVSSVHPAVAYLGFDTLKQLVLSVELFRTFKPCQTIAGFSLDDLQTHSHIAARIAGKLPVEEPARGAAVIAALLHDVGKLVMATRLPGEFLLALNAARKQQLPLHVVEKEQTGTTHAEIGAYLLGLWGLSGVVVDAVSRHHRPAAPESGSRELGVLAAAHIADALACEASRDTSAEAPADIGGVPDLEYLTQLGLDAQLPAWRAMARQVHADEHGGS